MNTAYYFEFFKRLIDRRHGDRPTSWSDVLLSGINARPHRHASITSWTEQKGIQRLLLFAFPSCWNLCDTETFDILEMLTGGQAYPSINLLRGAVGII